MDNFFEKKFNLIDIFKEPPKEPFSIGLTFNCNNIKDFYDNIKNLFIKGIIILSGDDSKNSIQINQIKKEQIEIMKKYMLSMGIEVKLKKYDNNEKDYLIKKLLYDMEKIHNLDIKIVKNWRTDLIDSIIFNFKIKKSDKITISKYNKILKKHYEANHFLNLTKKESLHDYYMLIRHSNEDVYILFFDIANRSDYKIC